MEPKLRIFVSSAIDDYVGHRDLILHQLNGSPTLQAYVFESAPAKALGRTNDFSGTYLTKLRDSDLVVVVLGKELRDAVLLEIKASIEMGLPVLLFLEERYRDREHIQQVCSMVRGKYQTFVRATELSEKVFESVNDYIIEAVRAYREHQ